MTDTLPQAIADYFSSKNARDFPAAAACFTETATVGDEGHHHQGRAAIESWMRDTSAKYHDRSELQKVTSDGNLIEVAAKVAGTFPGSPIVLRYRFSMDGDRISALRIGS